MRALTPREREVFALADEGKIYSEIAETLGISIYTVQTHVQHILTKLDVDSMRKARRAIAQ